MGSGYNLGDALAAWRLKLPPNFRQAQEATQVGIENQKLAGQSAQEVLLQRQRDRMEMERLFHEGKVPSSSVEAAKFMESEAAHQADLELKNAQTANYKATTAKTNDMIADPSRWRNVPNEPVTATPMFDPSGKPIIVNTPKTPGVVSLPEGSHFPQDVRQARNLSGQATTVEALTKQLDDSITRLESHYQGAERYVPGFMNPGKSLALRDYQMNLQALATPFGRLLGDTRISDQDRQSYSRAIGEPSQWFLTLDPSRARQRAETIKMVLADAKRKYGSVAPDLFAPEGEPANDTGATGEPSHGAADHAQGGRDSGLPAGPVNTDAGPPVAAVKTGTSKSGKPIYSMDGGKTWLYGVPPRQ